MIFFEAYCISLVSLVLNEVYIWLNKVKPLNI